MDVSKWLKIQVLLDVGEMRALMEHLDGELYDVSRMLECADARIEREDFLDAYARYVELRKTTKNPDISSFRPFFSAALSKEPIACKQMGNGRFLADVNVPVIQLQAHRFVMVDGKCLSMVHGNEGVSWGLQFAFPQVMMDGRGAVSKPLLETENGKMFRRLQRWMRRETTPVCIQGKMYSIRVGKEWETANHD